MYITEVATVMTAVAGAGYMGLLQAILGRNSCVGQNRCPKLPEARARQVFSLSSVYFVALPGGAFLLWWVETQTMARDSLLARVHHGGSTRNARYR